ncbi:YmfQ family protein [Burkholderia vietnamiensis]|uniref:YmfQ family protein n=1 Tax=Burkholderia vietnamiensis TaxID=60552 RepID=UPI001B91734E|nr:putative phage tail protein [Burkholderia vietnamiensis]MBR8054136.1 DUF2313 domain-containing protein [Burkholderia vietnamiensis]
MYAPDLTAADYLAVLQALMPRGRVWPRDQDAIQTKTLAGCAPSFARHAARSKNLITDGFPESAYELLPEWESALGLPDPCAGASPTVQQRRAQVIARLTATGGQSIAYFVEFARNLGYSISIENNAPARAGWSRCGDPCNSESWAHAWSIIAPTNTITRARAGQSAAGEPLATWGNDVLECELNALSPAHTILKFSYQTEIFDNSVVTHDDRPVVLGDGYSVVVGY